MPRFLKTAKVVRLADGTFALSDPQFAEPQPSADPASFVVAHGDDNPLYKLVQRGLLRALPAPRDPSATMTLADAWGSAGPAVTAALVKSGQTVFHSLGDTGSISGPSTQSLVADRMSEDYADPDPTLRPAFCYHLGDLIYSFGEARYYFDQFFEPYRAYPAPIFAIAGNHDGMVYRGDGEPSLDAFLRNFVTAIPTKTLESGGLIRTSMTQPAVYFLLTAPFVNIIGLFSNVLEDPGVISSEGNKTSPVDDQQLTFLAVALKQAAKNGGAIIIATHHPPYSGGVTHGGSPRMLADIDQVCKMASVWPHAHLSGHAHNYQRFTRTSGKLQIPYVVCGNGGHGLSALKRGPKGPLRFPVKVVPGLVMNNGVDHSYGYLRVTATATRLTIDFHAAQVAPSVKAPSDTVTVDLVTHAIVV